MASDELHQLEEDNRTVQSDDESSETADHCRPDQGQGQGHYRPDSSDANHVPFSYVERDRLDFTDDATTTITEYAPQSIGRGRANITDKLSEALLEANFASESYEKTVDDAIKGIAVNGVLDHLPLTSAVDEDAEEAHKHSAETNSASTDSHWYGHDLDATADKVAQDGGGVDAADGVVEISVEGDVADGVMLDSVGGDVADEVVQDSVGVDVANDGMINASAVNGASASFAVNEKTDKENLQPNKDNVHDEKGGSLPTDAPDLPNANDQEIGGALQTDPKEAIGETHRNARLTWVESPALDGNVEANATVADVVENEAKSNITHVVVEPTRQLIDNGPKPKPRLGQRSSLRLSALLPTPTRPKRKQNLAKTKSTSALPKQSSFKSFLVDDNEDEDVEKALAGRESNA